MRTKPSRHLLPWFRRSRCAECGKPAKETYCDVCGDARLQRTRDATLKSHQHGW